MDLLKASLPLLLLGCAPEIADDTTRITDARILAVRAEPAEAAPGESVRFTALVASRDGTLREATVDWSFCNARPSLSESGPVSARCLTDGDWLVPLGRGLDATGALPMDACRTFGPDAPINQQGASGARPFDPDVTGGYQQPLRASLRRQTDAVTGVVSARIACGVQGVTQAESAEFTRRYHRNHLPEITGFQAIVGGATAALEAEDATPLTVAPGASVRLQVQHPPCADETACGGAERYVVYDRAARALAVREEVLRVSWFATDGSFSDVRTTGENTWRAPAAPGAVTLWAVLRDDRGGVAWRSTRVNVQ